MGLYNTFFGKKDPELQAIEEKAFLEEKTKVEQEKKEKAIKDAEIKGKAKARGEPLQGSVDYKKTLENMGKGASKIMDWMATRQGVQDIQQNPFDITAPWEQPRKVKKKHKKVNISQTKKSKPSKDIHIHIGE